MAIQKKKNLKSFLREEDGKVIKKSLLISSLGLVLGFGVNVVNACSEHNSHSSGTGATHHASTHCNHSNHSSY